MCSNKIERSKKQEKIKKIFLENLPTKEGIGKLKGKQVIDWTNSIGYKVKGNYNGLEFEVEIINYDMKKHILDIKYLDKEPFGISTGHFQECKLGKLLHKYTGEFKIKIGIRIQDDNRDITIIDREVRPRKSKKGIINEKWYKYHCNTCGYNEGWMNESNLFRYGCSCCRGFTPVLGINTIWDTDRWMCDLGVSEEDAKKYTHGSQDKITVTCPECGNKKEISILSIYGNHSIGCEECGDGISYPEKFMFNLLKQLNVNFDTQKIFKWSKNIQHNNIKLCGNKIYDFYASNIGIIETHGRQHYEENRRKSKKVRNLKEEQENDRLKEQLARENGINNYIIIDCRKSELGWIKNNILNSKLNDLFDLSKINWIKCEEFACKSRIKEICEYKLINSNFTTIEIGMIFKLNRSTIIRYLKKGTKLGWCKYDPKEESLKGSSKSGKASGKPVEIFKDGISLGKFKSCADLVRQFDDLFKIKLLDQAISNVCLGKKKQYKGYTFKYVD